MRYTGHAVSKAEKLCLAAIFVVAALFVAVLLWAYLPTGGTIPDKEKAAEQGLSQPEDILPQSLTPGAAPPLAVLTDASGAAVDLQAYRGRMLVLLFWGSWCPYCEDQLALLPELETIADAYQAELVLVDKLDPEKETRAAAAETAAEAAPGYTLLFDEGLVLYKAWGLQRIPAVVVLRADGTVGAYDTAVLDEGEFDALLEYAQNGGDAATAANLKQNLTGADGGIYSNVDGTGAAPTGTDVLSETQGIVMQYAVLRQDKALFESAWQYVRQNMLSPDGLCAWYVSAGKPADVNATLDNLRICAALQQADALWGGYASEAQRMTNSLYTCCTNRDWLVNCCNLQSGAQSQRVALPCIDLATMRTLAAMDDRFAAVADAMQPIAEGGYISDEFPLYYAEYDLNTQQYSTAELNTAEALYTLWNLACADLLPTQSLAWLRERVCGEGLAARYTVTGEVPAGADYHSTAVYALAMLIGKQTGDADLTRAALQKMERYRVRSTAMQGCGGYGADGRAAAFDQCMPMLAHAWPAN